MLFGKIFRLRRLLTRRHTQKLRTTIFGRYEISVILILKLLPHHRHIVRFFIDKQSAVIVNRYSPLRSYRLPILHRIFRCLLLILILIPILLTIVRGILIRLHHYVAQDQRSILISLSKKLRKSVQREKFLLSAKINEFIIITAIFLGTWLRSV